MEFKSINDFQNNRPVQDHIVERVKSTLHEWGLTDYKVEIHYSHEELEGNILSEGSVSVVEKVEMVRKRKSKQRSFLSINWGSGIEEELSFYDLLYFIDTRYIDKTGHTRSKFNQAFVTLNSNNQIIRLTISVKDDLSLNNVPNELCNLQTLLLLSNVYPDIKNQRVKQSYPKLRLSKNITELEALVVFGCVRLEVEGMSKDLFFLKKLRSTLINNVTGESNPPSKILQQGLKSIQNYYLEMDQASEYDYLYEAKMVLVGRGFVGKTTLVKKLIEREYELEDNHNSTEGIDISEWDMSIPLEKSTKFKFNIWDFGGQEKYDATHQFFITERTLYLFVTESRQESNYLDFDYWLNVVEMLSDGSPVIVIQNKIDQRRKQLPSDRYGSLFKNIMSFVDVSCANGYESTLVDLEEKIKLCVQMLPQVGDELPKAWVDIRKKLEGIKADYISYKEYIAACAQYGLDKKRAEFLSRYFHDLGIILHYKKDPMLRNMVVLNPDWVVDGVYKVLDTREIEDKSGRFSTKELNSIWEDSKYEDKQGELLSFMINYGICFRLSKDEFIAPELLSPNRPMNFKPIPKKDRLTFIYQYDFMPAGLLTRLLVKLHKFLVSNMFWKHGMIIEIDDTQTMIVEDEIKKTIQVDIVGEDKRETLAIVRKELAEIYEEFNKKIKFEEFIPCNCDYCLRESDEPHFFKWKTIKVFSEKKKNLIPCELSAIDVSVQSLIGEIDGFELNGSFSSPSDIVIIPKDNSPKDDLLEPLHSGPKVAQDEWWKKSIIGGLIVGVVVFLLLILPNELNTVRVSILIGATVAGLMFIRNPKTRYMRGFWAVFSSWSFLNLFPSIQLRLGSSEQSEGENSSSFFEFLTGGPEILVNGGLILIMLVLLYYDFKERKN